MAANCIYYTWRVLLSSSLTLWNAQEDIKSLPQTEVTLRMIQLQQQWKLVLEKKVFSSQCKFQKKKGKKVTETITVILYKTQAQMQNGF